MSEGRPRIVFSTPRLAHPAISGPFLRIENSIKALARISALTIHCRDVSIDSSAVSYYRSLSDSLYFGPSANRLKWFARRVVRRLVRSALKKEVLPDRADDLGDAADLVRRADAAGADLIWLGYGNVSYPVLRYIKEHSKYPVVLDTDSVWSRFVLRSLPYAATDEERVAVQAEGKAKEEEERWGTRMADVTTAVSEVDAAYYRELTENPGSVRVFSNVIDVESYAAKPPEPPGFAKPCVYLAGTFWPSSPMEDAARWMIDEIMPLAWQQIPDLHFYIAGKDSDTVLSDVADRRITITGMLPSVLPHLMNAEAAVVPLRFESGTRFKILEAGACAVPVVSTTLGAEGIPVTHEKDILIGDDAASFAEGMVKIVRDKALAGRLAANLKELVSERNSVESLAREGETILDYLGIGSG